ncbi:hypothetical protein N7530_012808 [Penicillium desertorum]|uniref:Uncharacterized protein n=1 Tax=Penicillium desertorum TaxID=1303715 RepID=A0A9W9WD85_9EURO|nr:hypothetical protein N7530_012808 [Penicillium desertorum]
MKVVADRSFSPSKFEARGARKVTSRITGLWQPSVHSDVAFDPSMSALPIIPKQKSYEKEPLIQIIGFCGCLTRQCRDATICGIMAERV